LIDLSVLLAIEKRRAMTIYSVIALYVDYCVSCWLPLQQPPTELPELPPATPKFMAGTLRR